MKLISATALLLLAIAPAKADQLALANVPMLENTTCKGTLYGVTLMFRFREPRNGLPAGEFTDTTVDRAGVQHTGGPWKFTTHLGPDGLPEMGTHTVGGNVYSKMRYDPTSKTFITNWIHDPIPVNGGSVQTWKTDLVLNCSS